MFEKMISVLLVFAGLSGCYSSGDNCFAPGTQISVPGGGTVAIENLEIGDRVVSYDFATGKEVVANVAEIYARTAESQIYQIVLEDDRELWATPEHPFWSPEEKVFVRADRLAVGNTLGLLAGDGAVNGVKIKSMNLQDNSEPVYNFETDNESTVYFAEGVLTKYY